MKELWSALGHIAMDGGLLKQLQDLGTSGKPTIDDLKKVRGVLHTRNLPTNRQETWQINHIAVESKKARLKKAFAEIALAANGSNQLKAREIPAVVGLCCIDRAFRQECLNQANQGSDPLFEMLNPDSDGVLVSDATGKPFRRTPKLDVKQAHTAKLRGFLKLIGHDAPCPEEPVDKKEAMDVVRIEGWRQPVALNSSRELDSKAVGPVEYLFGGCSTGFTPDPKEGVSDTPLFDCNLNSQKLDQLYASGNAKDRGAAEVGIAGLAVVLAFTGYESSAKSALDRLDLGDVKVESIVAAIRDALCPPVDETTPQVEKLPPIDLA